MREILFRGKRKDNGEWVEGFYGEFHNRPKIQEENSCQIFEPREDAYLFRSCVGGLWHIIDRETLGQFTGLTDENGKKIFEGDVVKAFGALGNLNGCGVVNWNRLFSSWHIGERYALYGSRHVSTYEVIGNIHDNPELLEV